MAQNKRKQVEKLLGSMTPEAIKTNHPKLAKMVDTIMAERAGTEGTSTGCSTRIPREA